MRSTAQTWSLAWWRRHGLSYVRGRLWKRFERNICRDQLPPPVDHLVQVILDLARGDSSFHEQFNSHLIQHLIQPGVIVAHGHHAHDVTAGHDNGMVEGNFNSSRITVLVPSTLTRSWSWGEESGYTIFCILTLSCSANISFSLLAILIRNLLTGTLYFLSTCTTPINQSLGSSSCLSWSALPQQNRKCMNSETLSQDPPEDSTVEASCPSFWRDHSLSSSTMVEIFPAVASSWSVGQEGGRGRVILDGMRAEGGKLLEWLMRILANVCMKKST